MEGVFSEEEKAELNSEERGLFGVLFQFVMMSNKEMEALFTHYPDAYELMENMDDPDNEDGRREIITYTIIRDEHMRQLLKTHKEPFLFIEEIDLFLWGGHGWGYSYEQDAVLRAIFRQHPVYYWWKDMKRKLLPEVLPIDGSNDYIDFILIYCYNLLYLCYYRGQEET